MNARAELQVDRSSFLGGSDSAAVLGVSPWRTPLDLYLLKTHQKVEVIDAQREKIFRRGRRLEPIVIDMLIEELGLKVTKRSTPEDPNRYTDPLEPYLAAEIDFEWEVTAEIAERYDLPEALIGTIQNGEVKTSHPWAGDNFGEAETDEIPVEYAAQAMHGLMVTARQVTLFGVLVGSDNLTPYFIRRDDETIAGMREREIDFWLKHVVARVPPKPLRLPDVLQLFKRLPASRTPATPEIVALVEKLAFAKVSKAQFEELEIEAKYEIGRYMLGEAGVFLRNDGKLEPGPEVKLGVHELHVGGTPILQVCLRNSTRLDSDAIKEKHPAVAAECSKTNSFFVYQTPRKKGKAK